MDTRSADENQCNYPRHYLTWIVSEITQATRTSPSIPRQDTRFFQIVTGGNVIFVKDVINHLLRHEMFDELQWIFGGNSWQRNKQDRDEEIKTEGKCTKCVCVLNRMLFPFFFFLHMCFIPIFWLWHSILHNGYLAFRHRASA